MKLCEKKSSIHVEMEQEGEGVRFDISEREKSDSIGEERVENARKVICLTTCMKCLVKEATMCSDPCRHTLVCTKCACKMATGGKVSSVFTLFTGTKQTEHLLTQNFLPTTPLLHNYGQFINHQINLFSLFFVKVQSM